MDNKGIIKNIGISMIMKPISMIISLIYTSVVLNYLGETKYGVWAIVLNVLSWIGYFDIGIGNGLRNKLAEAVAINDKDSATKYVSTAYVATAVISVVFCAIILILWHSLDLSTFFNINLEGISANIVIDISVAFLCINFVIGLSKTIMYAIQKPGVISVTGVVGQALQLAVVAILGFVLKQSIIAVSIMYGIISMIENIILSLLIRIKYPYYTFSFKKIDRTYLKPLMGLGLGFFFMQICSLILNTTDNLLISNLFGPEEVTPYNMVYKVFYMFVQIHAIIIMPMWSAYTAASKNCEFSWMKRTYCKINMLTLAISAGVGIAIFLFKPFAKLWLQQELDYGQNLIWLTALYMIIQMFCSNMSSFLCGVGEIKVSVIISVVGAIINIPLSILFASNLGLGVSGIILGSLCVMSISLIVLPFVVFKWFRHNRIKPEQEYENQEIENGSR